MTESKWLTCEDPQRMLDYLTAQFSVVNAWGDVGSVSPAVYTAQKISDRKLRLFDCACVRQVWHLLNDDHSRQAVVVAERFADGQATEEELAAAWDTTWATTWAASADTRKHQANLLRDIVGNPFRSVRLTGPCPWLTSQVLSLAHAAYDERQPDGTLDPLRLAVLADALEEAGCSVERLAITVVIYGGPGGHEWEVVGRRGGQDTTLYRATRLADARRWAEAHLAARNWHRFGTSAVSPSLDWPATTPHYAADGLTPEATHPLLQHLRSPGPHYRGCWAMDLILGKE